MMTKSSLASIALSVLITLATSAVLAQQQPGDGNIPAPDLFDSQIVCSSRLPSTVPTPTVVAKDAMESALDTAIGMGNVQITGGLILNDLGYVIPSAGSNCGQGIGQLPFTVAGQGAVATDVAEGYSALLPKFTVVYGDPNRLTSTGTAGAVASARAALAAAEADETTSSSRLDSLRRTLNTAIERDNDARAEFDAIAQGPIYQAAAAEWMAKSAVTQSIANYNTAITETLTAQATLDTMNYSGYVPLGNQELVQSVVLIFGGMGTVNLAQLTQYVNGDLSNPQIATVDDDGVTDTSDSNFDRAGNLVVPMQLVDGAPQSISISTVVSTARTNRDNYRIAADALKELSAENQNLLLQTIIDEAARRAQLEADYYEQQFQKVLTDTTNQNPVTVDLPSTPENEAEPYSIASRHAEYLGASNKRVVAEADLRAKAAAREAATQNVIDAFQNPGSFYAQLVARREALKARADQLVADSSSPSTSLTAAAEAAAKALREAEEALTSYQSLAGDPENPDNPIPGLVNTLLETDGDDGQAVVDAISRTYQNTVENMDSIDALTADTEDGAEEDGAITANRKAIAGNSGEIGSLGDRVTQNETDIESLMDGMDTNTEMISANAGRIAVNANNISANAGNIASNASFISQNAANIAHNSARIDVNEYNIAQNSERIGMNTAAIGLNTGMIAENRNMIGEIGGQLDAMRGGIAASIAMSRMPAIDGGISFGAGMYGGESAFAVGFALERKRTTFDIGLTSSGGEVGAGIGMGVKLWGN